MNEETEQQMGNIKLKVKKGTDTGDMQVYKCPFLNCTEFFSNYDDLQSHKVLVHQVVPKFFNQVPGTFSRSFSKKRLGKQKFLILQYKFGIMSERVSLWWTTRGDKSGTRTTARRNTTNKAEQ